jgi:hypothetical protein
MAPRSSGKASNLVQRGTTVRRIFLCIALLCSASGLFLSSPATSANPASSPAPEPTAAAVPQANRPPEPYRWAGLYTIRSLDNNRLVAAEVGYTGSNYGMLRARTPVDQLGLWEKFNLWYDNTVHPTVWVFQSRANLRYIAAEIPASGLLRARSTAIGPWEKFYLGFGPQRPNILIQSQANGLLVAAENGSNSALRARTGLPGGAWEQFDLHRL